jgi:hypothetical protein
MAPFQLVSNDPTLAHQGREGAIHPIIARSEAQESFTLPEDLRRSSPARWRFRLAAAGVQFWQAMHPFKDLGAETCHSCRRCRPGGKNGPSPRRRCPAGLLRVGPHTPGPHANSHSGLSCFQTLASDFPGGRNCQAGVSPKCHIPRTIDCGASIFRDRGADF